MHPDDDICLCFHVSQRKVVSFCKRERPAVVSQISECLAAGTGCGWCVPFLMSIHQKVMAGDPNPDLPVSPAEYAENRALYRKKKTDDPPA